MYARFRFICFFCAAMVCGTTSISRADIHTYMFDLDGSQEVGAGDPDGFGTALIMIDDVNLTIDWDITVSNIELPLTGAHIHAGAAGANGGVIVNFGGQLSGSGLADPDLAAVLANPTGHYVNLHNSEFGSGAIRGQFTEAIPEPGTFGLLALAGCALGLRRRKR